MAATHQGLTAELGAAREVVSRILKRSEREETIVAEQGEIRIGDASVLVALARGE